MPMLNDQPDAMRAVLENARTIAVVGYSDKPDRPSHQIANYLRAKGYTVIPVNPQLEEVDGLKSYPTVQAIGQPVDIVDVFRPSDALPGVVEDAIAAGAKTVWAQLGVENAEAARRADEAGLNVVMNHCIKVEHHRLLGS